MHTDELYQCLNTLSCLPVFQQEYDTMGRSPVTLGMKVFQWGPLAKSLCGNWKPAGCERGVVIPAAVF